MIKKINIKGLRINFVFRHWFEKNLDTLGRFEMNRKEIRFGLWFKTYLAISKLSITIGKDSKMTRGYMLGADLFVCKFWIDICNKPLTFNVD